MFYYFIVFVILIAIIAALFFISFKIWQRMKQQVVESDSIVGDKSGEPRHGSRYRME